MISRHKDVKSMRAYLLGTADASAADAFEDRYFTDRGTFIHLNACERDLIIDYLDGRLSPAVARLFESRYLTVPVLRRRLEDVRRERRVPIKRRAASSIFWQCAAAVLLVIAVFAGIRLSRFHTEVSLEAHQPALVSKAPTPVLVIVLEPGINKGPGGGTDLVLPASGGGIRFLLEGRGLPHDRDIFADTTLIEADGSAAMVRKSARPLPADFSSGSPRFVLDLDSAILHRGDYMINLHERNGPVLERFLFRISRQ